MKDAFTIIAERDSYKLEKPKRAPRKTWAILVGGGSGLYSQDLYTQQQAEKIIAEAAKRGVDLYKVKAS